MRKMSQEKKKSIMRVIMLIMAIMMIMGFVILPIAADVSAEEADEGMITVSAFETGKLADAINEAKGSTDLNQITHIAVLSGTLNAADYNAILGYPNIEYLELAGCKTENGIIPDSAVESRNQLTYVSLPKNTVSIGARAFANNRKLIKISCPKTLREIGDSAFEGCEAMTLFDIPASLEKMGTSAFKDCKSMTSFAIPQAITEIPAYCFSKCSITELHLGPQVTKIGDGAFADCYELKDIYFYGTTAPSANEGVFQNLKATLHTYEDGEGFDSMNSNFLSVAYDLPEDSVYTPPEDVIYDLKEYTEQDQELVFVDDGPHTKGDEEPAAKPETEENVTKAETTVETNEETEEASSESEDAPKETEAAPTGASGSASSSGTGTGTAIIIAVLAAALGVTVTLLITSKKKK
ncbi:MAG: leucine-rich repeat domain-containing protein [Huintestinicola sp.]